MRHFAPELPVLSGQPNFVSTIASRRYLSLLSSRSFPIRQSLFLFSPPSLLWSPSVPLIRPSFCPLYTYMFISLPPPPSCAVSRSFAHPVLPSYPTLLAMAVFQATEKTDKETHTQKHIHAYLQTYTHTDIHTGTRIYRQTCTQTGVLFFSIVCLIDLSDSKNCEYVCIALCLCILLPNCVCLCMIVSVCLSVYGYLYVFMSNRSTHWLTYSPWPKMTFQPRDL